MGVKSPELACGGTPASNTGAGAKIGAPAQVGSSLSKRVKVTVPVGSGTPPPTPVTVAVSLMVLPMVTGPSAWVSMIGVAWAKTTVSSGSPQAVAEPT